MPTAIEEMLRYTSPVVALPSHGDGRHGDPRPADRRGRQGRWCSTASANRDEDVFADPDRFDVGRDPNPHMAFGGGGPHLCLGMHVARSRSARCCASCSPGCPDLAPAGEPERLASNFIAGVRSMPVTFTPARP